MGASHIFLLLLLLFFLFLFVHENTICTMIFLDASYIFKKVLFNL